MFVCAINGSPNSKGNTAFLLQRILDELPGTIETKLIHLHPAVVSVKKTFCTACFDCKGACFADTPLEEVFNDMKRAKVLIFGSPVYFGAPTAQIKVLFDKSRMYRKERAFVGKFAGAVTVGGSKYGGQEMALRTLHDMFLVHGMSVFGDGSIEGDAGHGGVCAHRPASEDEFALARCKVMAGRIIEICNGF